MGRHLVRFGLGAAAASAAALALALLVAPYGAKRSTAEGDAGSDIAERERQPLVSAAALAGRAVHDADGTEAGKLASFLVDTRTGRIRSVVVHRRSGSDPPGDEEVEMPPSAMLDLPAAPDGPVRLHAAEAVPRDAAPASAPDAMARDLEQVDKRGQALAPLRDLRGATVRTPFGDTLGTVGDIVLGESPEPRIAYVTVIRGSGDQTNAIALPFAACAWRPAENSVLVVADPDTLKAAPVVAVDRPAAPLDDTKAAALRRAFGF
jgi:sporulation protein YlmC with PRC-barrel domain